MGRAPEVSICIPTFNRAAYLDAALMSVVAQTSGDFEAIVFDDASTDQTGDVVRSLGDPRVRYFRQKVNVGIAANRNSCLGMARGRYVAWLDSDDLYRPWMLATQKAVLEAHPDVGLVHGAASIIDEKGRTLPDWPAPFSSDAIEPGPEAFSELVLGNYVLAPTVMVRRACYDRVGAYRTSVSGSEDWDMWLRVSRIADLAYTSARVASYRYHSRSVSAESGRSPEGLVRDALVVESAFADEAEPTGSMDLRARAGAAHGSRVLDRMGEFLAMGRQEAALSALDELEVPDAGPGPAAIREAILRGDEYEVYRHSKALLERFHRLLAGTRYGRSLEKRAVRNDEWEASLGRIAEAVRSIVPPDRRVVVIDKHDPTILHRSQRQGWHFPDRRMMPGGYPSDGGAAVRHLEALYRRGADYLVIPSAAFWWLEHYRELAEHLQSHANCVRSDDLCAIYRLEAGRVGEART